MSRKLASFKVAGLDPCMAHFRHLELTGADEVILPF